MGSAPGKDRYEPLPGVLGLPGFLWRKLSARGRRIGRVVIALLAVAVAVGAALLVPAISENKREQEARERREERAAAAERVRQLREEQRPRRGRAGATGAAAMTAEVEGAITVDANRRVRAGDLDTRVKHTECRTIDVAGSRRWLGCTAVTSVIPANETTEGGLLGYPYRALLHEDTRRYAFCKTSGQPGEGSLTGRTEVALPRVCGG